MQLTKMSISEMASTLTASDGKLIIMYIPTKMEIYWNYLDDESKGKYIAIESREYNVGGLKYLDPNMHVQRQVMRELAAEIGVSFFDLTPALEDAIRAGQSPYFFADTHWNQVGHDIVRSALLDFLNRSNLDK